MSHFRIQGTNGFIVDSDGNEHALSTIIAEACQGLGAVMDEFRSENQGKNLSVGFSSKYFPKKGEVTGAQRSALNAKKARAHLAIYDACLALGIPEDAMTFSEGFPGRNGWVGSKRVYFNIPQASTGDTTMNAKDQLESQYTEHDGDIDQLLSMQEKLQGKDAMYIGWLRNQVRSLKAQAETRSVTEQVQTDVPADTGEGEVDTSAL